MGCRPVLFAWNRPVLLAKQRGTQKRTSPHAHLVLIFQTEKISALMQFFEHTVSSQTVTSYRLQRSSTSPKLDVFILRFSYVYILKIIMRIELTSRQLTSTRGFGCIRAASTARRTPAMMQRSIEIMHILCVQNEELGKIRRTERKHVKLACFVHRPFSLYFRKQAIVT